MKLLRPSLVLLLLFSLLSLYCLGQSPSPPDYRPQIVPPSPTAAALGKYGDVPVSYATGIPQIAIPIYEIKGKLLNLPISLSYHAGGFKVGEKPGWLGFGWSLTGGNGVITRTIRGIADNDGSKGYQVNFDSINQTTYTDTFQEKILHGEIDSEPDDYSYNFAGRSGKLFFRRDSVFTMPYEKIQISISENSAAVVTADGTFYTFSATEKYRDGENADLTQSWYLTGIESINETESIGLSYTEPFLVDDPYEPEMTTAFYTAGQTECGEKDPVVVDKGKVRFEVRLRQITFEHTILRFNGQARLETIDVLEVGLDTAQTKRFVFSYHNNLLVDVEEQALDDGGTITGALQHHFTYYDGSPHKYQRDHWGFNNGALRNEHLFPIGVQDLLPANRESSGAPGVQEALSLKSITYPTGAVVTFDYEPNTYWAPAERHLYSMGDRVERLDAEWNNSMVRAPVSSSHFFSILKDQHVRLDVMCTYNQGVGEGLVPAEGQLMTFKIIDTNNQAEAFSRDYAPASVLASALPVSQFLPVGAYEARITVIPAEVPSHLTTAMRLDAEVTYNHYVENSSVVESVTGGIRIKRITTTDGMGLSPDIVKRFVYTTALLDGTGTPITISSGTKTIVPNYTYSYAEWQTHPNSPAQPFECIRTGVTNGEEAIAGSGSPVYYREVTELLGENGEFGKNIYYHKGASTQGGGYPYAPVRIDYQAGLVDSTEQYVRDGQTFRIVSKTRTKYQFHTNTLGDLNRRTIRGAKVFLVSNYIVVNGVVDDLITAVNPYELVSEWYYIKENSETLFQTGQPSIEKKTGFFYENPRHIQMTRSEETGSDGSKTISKRYYPEDFASQDPALVAIKGSMPATVIREITQKERNGVTAIIGARLNRYELESMSNSSGQGIVLREIHTMDTSIPVPQSQFSLPSEPFQSNTQFLSKKISMDAYDPFGNIEQFTQPGNFFSSYIWGDNGNRMIAQVLNAHRDQVAFTSFEYSDHGGWHVSGGFATMSAGEVKTGEKGRHSCTLTSNALPSTNYVVSLWSKGNGTVTVNGLPKASSANWQLLEWTLPPTTSVTVISSGTTIDDVRLRPSAAQMTTYTYDPGGRTTSATDPNGLTTTYEYDAFKRLKLIRNHKKEILHQYSYNYSNGLQE